MKFFCQIFSVTFVAVGSVMGAGFVTGRELISFFGNQNFVPYLIFSCALLCLFFMLLFYMGNKFNSVKNLNENLMKNPKVFSLAILVACFISTSSLLAGLDTLFFSLTGVKAPILSVVILLIVCFTSKYGVNGVEKISVIFIPIILFLLNYLIFKKGELNFSSGGGNFVKGTFGAFVFAFMNVFINLPPLVEVASGKTIKALVTSAILSAGVLFVQSLLIIAVVGVGVESDMPLLSAIKGGGVGVFSITLLFSMITSVCSAFYPLYGFAKEKAGGYGVALVGVSAFCFSRLGLTNIVNYAYPLIAVFGVLYIAKCLIWYKKNCFADNKGKTFIVGGKYVKKEKDSKANR